MNSNSGFSYCCHNCVISKSHDLAHIVGDAVIKNKLCANGEVLEKFNKQLLTAVYRYLLRRIWVPYHSLVSLYPSLEGKRILLPLYEIRRWFRLFRKETFARSRTELKVSSAVPQEVREQTTQMLSDLGLLT